ncbi:MAG TPA: CHASE3 domain-containing protein, partial [Polyangiaceae bacterium]|nr:CHASE3 domain-containing protein [Polyangiaceae bacterium]
MTWTFGRKLALGFAISVLTVLVIGVAGHRATTDLIDNDRWVEHTYEVKHTLTELLSSLKDVETGQRGYLLTGDDAFLEPYKAGLNDVDKYYADAKRLTADNTSQRERITALRSIIDQRLQLMAKSIALRRGENVETFAKSGILQQGKQQMDELRRRISELDETESQLLSQRQTNAKSATASAQATIVWGSLIGTLLVGIAGLVMSRSLTAQIGVTVRHVQASAAELQAAANQQASGAKEQATAMTEVTTTISELLATSRQIADSARRVADIASQTATQARAGDSTVGRGTEAVAGIKRQVDAIVSHMLELGKKSQQIGSVLDIVAELAEQTN